ncbi:MAG: protein kinase [Acidobacteriota bacterium]|nr:protein kinase [Acidobacteriota bacterium]
MPLTPGSRLGPYEVVAPIGAGGMGEVYRARDTRLDRDVAVKVLPPHLSASEEGRQRFEREARTISQLSHPHICALYDVGRDGETDYLVMELLEGETLSDRLAKGALPTDAVLRFGIEIADALDKAHRQGIVHRDLKPGNVMLTRSGVKLLDFGLAKAIAPLNRDSGLTTTPTLVGSASPNLTQEGSILGTFQYMAPEQLEGKEADARTDIFAFGAVLYEMATGRKAFAGSSQASLISNIMKEEPAPISTIQPMTPPALDRVVRTCLAKDPEDRFQTAHDAKLQIQWVAEGGSQAGAPAVVTARRKSRERLAWAVATVAVLAAALAAFGYLRRAPAEARPMRSSLLPPEKTSFDFAAANIGSLSISPDGRRVTFVAKGEDGKSLLWLRSLEELTARPLAGTEGANWPFWSPDSRFVAFFADKKLKKIDVAGAPPLTLCDAPNGRSGSWSRDDVILFSPDSITTIHRVSAGGGAATPVTKLDESRSETTHRWATFLPDGRHFLYMAGTHAAGTKSEANAIYLAELGSNERKLLLQARSNVVYASGHLLYVLERTLLAHPFDAKRLRLTGNPVPVADTVLYGAGFFRAAFSASDDGVLVYGAGSADSRTRLQWHDRAGKPAGEPVGEPAEYESIAISPDGGRVATTITDPGTGTPDVWLFDLSRGVKTRLTFGPTPSGFPIWSPDGARIAYTRVEKQLQMGIFVKSSSGAGGEEALLHADGQAGAASWSSDGRFLALDLFRAGTTTQSDIWILPLFGDRKAYAFLATAADETGPHFSPDGRWLLYASDESGRDEVYVAPFPGPGGKWQVSTGGALGGEWVKGGREIFYITEDGAAMSVEVKADASGFEAGVPKLLFRSTSTQGDLTADGERFLLAVRPDGAQSSSVMLVANWPAGLKK